MSLIWERQGLRKRNGPVSVTPLWALVGAIVALAALGYAFAHLWLRLPVERWMR